LSPPDREGVWEGAVHVPPLPPMATPEDDDDDDDDANRWSFDAVN